VEDLTGLQWYGCEPLCVEGGASIEELGRGDPFGAVAWKRLGEADHDGGGDAER